MTEASASFGLEYAGRAFTRLFEAASTGLALLDLDGRVFAINGVLSAILGSENGALLGAAVVDIVNPSEIARVQEDFSRFASGLDDELVRESKIMRRDGFEISIRALALLIRDATGKPAFVLVMVDPVDLEQSRIRGVAHDLNNLLMAIQGYGELLVLHAEEPSRVKANAGVVKSIADRSVVLVRELLVASNQQHIQRINVNDVILGLRAVAAQLVGSGHELVLQLDPSGPVVELDRVLFERALINLTTNGRDSMPDGGTLTIKTEARDSFVDVSVCDTGVGIDPETLERIFERDFTTKPLGLGYGIGLANVSEFISAAKGSIQVGSTVGVGSTFTMSLPRASRHAAD